MTARDTVRADGATLSLRNDGEAGRPWLLLSNSLATDAGMWDDQMPLLTRTHRVVRCDTRGHGSSSAPEGPYSFDMLVADMVAVLDHVGATTADVMGLSLGGMTALGLALAHPERVRSLVVADARADAPPPFVEAWDARIAAVREGGMAAVLDSTLERWFTERGRARRPEAVERAHAMILRTSPAGYIGCAAALQRLDYLRRLPDLKAPALYVVGSEDSGAPKDAMQAMADATPGGRLAVIEGAAHVSNMEDPAAFNAAIADWFSTAARKAG
jgi:3-oxoadipate enol-lactonase